MPSAVPAIRSIDERDDHFIVTETDGSTYRVDKDGLESDTLAHIQGMAHGGLVIAGRVDPGPAEEAPWEERPKGGEPEKAPKEEKPKEDDKETPRFRIPRHLVGTAPSDTGTLVVAPEDEKPLEMADGGMVAPDAGVMQGAFIEQPFMPLVVPSGLTDGGVPPSGPSWLEQLNGAPLEASQLLDVPRALLRPVGEYLQQNTPADSPGGQILSAIGLPPPPGGTFDALTGERLPVPAGPAAERGVIGPLPETPVEEAPPQEKPAPSPTFGTSRALREFDAGVAQQAGAMEAKAELEAERAKLEVAIREEEIARRMEMEARHAEEYAAIQRQGDDLFQAVLNSKIDPNRIWADADVGSRLTAGIAVILSGIGQGLGGGPNLAIQQIDRLIDMDVAAQKVNLARQENLLSVHLQRGRDMLSAQRLAKADLQDLYAGKLAHAAATFGGQEAKIAAQLSIGALRTAAAGDRQQVMARDLQMQVTRLQMDMARQKAEREAALTAALVNAPRTAAGGIRLRPQDLEALPEDKRERSVFLPDGSVGFAQSKAQAEKLREGFRVLSTFRSGLQRYASLLKDGSPVLPPLLGGDRKLATGQRRDLVAQLAKLEETGVLQKHDLEFLEPLVPDITEIFTADVTHEQALQALLNALNDRILSNLKTLRGN